MSTYTQLLYQIVFGSKDYTAFLNQENQGLLFGYLVGMLNKRKCHPYQVGDISMKPVLIKYVLNQEEHHKKISFMDEMIELLNDNLVQYDEDYLLI